jgi:hypothetical protein
MFAILAILYSSQRVGKGRSPPCIFNHYENILWNLKTHKKPPKWVAKTLNHLLYTKIMIQI